MYKEKKSYQSEEYPHNTNYGDAVKCIPYNLKGVKHMANIKKHIAKNGKITYYIRAFDGYDNNGEQIVRSMTWSPPSNLTERQTEKELQRQTIKFEEAVKKGTCFNSNTRFEEYASEWLENNKPPVLAPKTYVRYQSLLVTINAAIGNIPLIKLQSHHLQKFYNNLRENGVKQKGTYAVANNLKSFMKDRSISRNKLAEASGLSGTTITSACHDGKHISIYAAEKIAKALNLPIENIFTLNKETSGFSAKTILNHHRLISSILAQATRDRIIPFNIADKNYMKAPKLDYHEAAFLDDEQVKHVLTLLSNEDIKWKTAMYLLIFSGMRRGELMGLEWNDIDFENRVIHIRRTSQYVQKMGIITKSPKNETSIRTIKLSEIMFRVLREYKLYWDTLRTDMLDRWKPFIEIKLADGNFRTVRNERLFIKDDSTPMNPDSITDWTRKFVEKNHLPYFTPHSLRHTHATLLIAEGVSIPAVSHRLGHSSIATTTRIYVHAIQSADEIASDVLDHKLNAGIIQDNEEKIK